MHKQLGDDILSSDDFRELADELIEERDELGEEEQGGWMIENGELLRDIEDAASVSPDEEFILDNYFVEYARNLAEQLYPAHWDSWPFNAMNWDEAAEALQSDYTVYEIGGETYYRRSL